MSFRPLAAVAVAATLAAALWGASPAQATTYNVTSSGAYNLGTVQMTGNIAGYGFFDAKEYAGPIVLQGTTGSGKPFSIITYCFDLLHPISAGFGYQAPVNYTYTSSALANDQSGGGGTGNALSLSQIERISGLARLGATLFTNNSSDLAGQMPAIQAAIWSIENNITASNFSVASAQGYYDDYMTRTFPGLRVPGLVSRDSSGLVIGANQGLLNASVPEPASWALLVIGFGLVGVTTRRRKTATVSA